MILVNFHIVTWRVLGSFFTINCWTADQHCPQDSNIDLLSADEQQHLFLCWIRIMVVGLFTNSFAHSCDGIILSRVMWRLIQSISNLRSFTEQSLSKLHQQQQLPEDSVREQQLVVPCESIRMSLLNCCPFPVPFFTIVPMLNGNKNTDNPDLSIQILFPLPNVYFEIW